MSPPLSIYIIFFLELVDHKKVIKKYIFFVYTGCCRWYCTDKESFQYQPQTSEIRLRNKKYLEIQSTCLHLIVLINKIHSFCIHVIQQYIFFQITFNNPIKACFFISIILLQFKHAQYKIVNRIFLVERLVLIGFLKIIGVQNNYLLHIKSEPKVIWK